MGAGEDKQEVEPAAPEDDAADSVDIDDEGGDDRGGEGGREEGGEEVLDKVDDNLDKHSGEEESGGRLDIVLGSSWVETREIMRVLFLSSFSPGNAKYLTELKVPLQKRMTRGPTITVENRTSSNSRDTGLWLGRPPT